MKKVRLWIISKIWIIFLIVISIVIFVGGIAAAIAGKKILESKAVKEGCTKGMAAVLAAKKDAEECYQDMVQNAEDIVVDANKDDKKAIYVEDDE